MMPIFEYQCEACAHRFDKLQKLDDKALTDCPDCGAPHLKKLLSAPAFHLKGSGWRKSDESPQKTHARPRIGHTLDSPIPHGDHHDEPPAKDARDKSSPDPHGHTHDHGHSHSHGHHHKKS